MHVFVMLFLHICTALFPKNIFSFRKKQTIEELFKKSIALQFVLPGAGDNDIRLKVKHPIATSVTSREVEKGNLCKCIRTYLSLLR